MINQSVGGLPLQNRVLSRRALGNKTGDGFLLDGIGCEGEIDLPDLGRNVRKRTRDCEGGRLESDARQASRPTWTAEEADGE